MLGRMLTAIAASLLLLLVGVADAQAQNCAMCDEGVEVSGIYHYCVQHSSALIWYWGCDHSEPVFSYCSIHPDCGGGYAAATEAFASHAALENPDWSDLEEAHPGFVYLSPETNSVQLYDCSNRLVAETLWLGKASS